MAGCLAGQRDWRRITIADGAAIGAPGQYGAGRAPSTPWGSFNFPNFQTTSFVLVRSQSSGTNWELVLNGILAQNYFNFIEVGLTNGQSRFFYPDPLKGLSAFNQNIGANTTQWDWSSLPAGYTWNSGDVGKVVTLGIG
jgi:hypothetical protein